MAYEDRLRSAVLATRGKITPISAHSRNYYSQQLLLPEYAQYEQPWVDGEWAFLYTEFAGTDVNLHWVEADYTTKKSKHFSPIEINNSLHFFRFKLRITWT